MTSALQTSELTVIASDIKINGTIEVQNELHFFGQIHGEIKGSPDSIIHLKEGSLSEGKIIAHNVIVDGFVKGEIRCSGKVWITRHGRVVGSVNAPTLQVDAGAVFEAKVGMS